MQLVIFFQHVFFVKLCLQNDTFQQLLIVADCQTKVLIGTACTNAIEVVVEHSYRYVRALINIENQPV